MKNIKNFVACSFFLSLSAFADETSYQTCMTEVSAKSTTCTTEANLPTTGTTLFKNGKNAICDLNYHALENVNHMLCFLKHKLEFDGAVATGSKTVDSIAYTWTLETTGLDSFATTAGYTNKLSVKADDKTQMVMWWDGKDDASKGYMISNKLGVTLSNELAIYVQWDKTTEAQWVRYIRGTWDATLNTEGPMDLNDAAINRGKYGFMKFNTTNNTVNNLEIVDVVNPAGATAACELWRIWGDTDTTLAIGYKMLGNTTNTSKVFAILDPTARNTYDMTTGADSGDFTALTDVVAEVTGPGDFSRSCNDVYGYRAGYATSLFEANADSVRLTFTKTPTDAFGDAVPTR